MKIHNPMALAKFTMPSLVRTAGELKPDIITCHKNFMFINDHTKSLNNSRSVVRLPQNPLGIK
jgi:hypothetical protein